MDMDLNTLRIGVTLSAFALFVALIAHSWSRRRQPEHAAAAMLPFVGEVPSEVAPFMAPEPNAGGRA